MLKPGARVAVAGAGVAGTHLAYALARHQCQVTVFEPASVGGVRIPLVHACQTPKTRLEFWQTATDFSRNWYRHLIQEGFPIAESESPFGSFFTFNARRMLRGMYAMLKAAHVERRLIAFTEQDADDFDFHFVATGTTSGPGEFRHLASATQKLGGYESYASRVRACSEVPEETLLLLPPRAAVVHRRTATAASARVDAAQLIQAGRYALFHDERLVTRDRLPVVGFAPAPIYADYNEFRWQLKDVHLVAESAQHKSPFLFRGMGYHGMTYAPFLAERVAGWLTGAPEADENLICALTPARFLPRL